MNLLINKNYIYKLSADMNSICTTNMNPYPYYETQKIMYIIPEHSLEIRKAIIREITHYKLGYTI